MTLQRLKFARATPSMGAERRSTRGKGSVAAAGCVPGRFVGLRAVVGPGARARSKSYLHDIWCPACGIVFSIIQKKKYCRCDDENSCQSVCLSRKNDPRSLSGDTTDLRRIAYTMSSTPTPRPPRELGPGTVCAAYCAQERNCILVPPISVVATGESGSLASPALGVWARVVVVEWGYWTWCRRYWRKSVASPERARGPFSS